MTLGVSIRYGLQHLKETEVARSLFELVSLRVGEQRNSAYSK